jgi:hypothetical protein
MQGRPFNRRIDDIGKEVAMEKRKSARKNILLRLYYLLEEDRQEREATIIDLSERGIRFEAAEKLPVGTRLKLDFPDGTPSGEEDPFCKEGVVVWSIQPILNKLLYRIGIKYI